MNVLSIMFWGIIIGLIIMAIMIFYDSHKSSQKINYTKNWFIGKGYTITKSIGTLCIDENKKKWIAAGVNTIFDYSDIIDFEIVENGQSYKSKGGISRAIAGGVLFGGVGALVGASTANKVSTVNSMYLNIITRNSATPRVMIYFINSPTKTDSFVYSNNCELAKQMIAQLTYMQDYAKRSTPTSVDEDIDYSNVISTKVVGVTKKNDEGVNIQNILSELEDGSKLTFIREPQNPYDTNAIKVICDYQHIGYIKASLAEEIAPIMDSGRELKGYISEITGGTDGKNYGCNIHISI